MAILRICAADGCNTKTLGSHCIQHETRAAARRSWSTASTCGGWPARVSSAQSCIVPQARFASRL